MVDCGHGRLGRCKVRVLWPRSALATCVVFAYDPISDSLCEHLEHLELLSMLINDTSNHNMDLPNPHARN